MKHNYSNYSKEREENVKENESVITETVEEEVVETVEETIEPEVVETVEETIEPEVPAEPTIKTGIVSNCIKLNVRKEPTPLSTPVAVIDAGTEVEVNMDESTVTFFKVVTANGVEGFCMNKYITIQ